MKKVIAYACVGTHGQIYCCATSADPAKVGRYEVFFSRADAERMALSPKHVVQVTIAKRTFNL